MKTVSLSGSLRENVGKKDAKKIRSQGQIPCVLYGGKEQIHFIVDYQKFSKLIFTPEVYIINIEIDGKEYQSLLQDVQYHPVTDRVLHADFLEIMPDKPVKVALPIHLVGNSIGILRGGRLIQNLRKLQVKGMIKDIPEYIDIDIAKLEIGDSIKVKELSAEKLYFIDVASQVVVAIKVTRVVEAEEEEEEEGEEAVEGGEKPAEGGEEKSQGEAKE